MSRRITVTSIATSTVSFEIGDAEVSWDRLREIETGVEGVIREGYGEIGEHPDGSTSSLAITTYARVVE